MFIESAKTNKYHDILEVPRGIAYGGGIMNVIAEYLWLDGKKPLADIRGKTKIFTVADGMSIDRLALPLALPGASTLSSRNVPVWGFDGSSTEQATGGRSDCVLRPVRIYADPFRSKIRPHDLSVIVLNEVFLAPGEEPHVSNTRAALRRLEEKYHGERFWFGIEQEYTFMRLDGEPLGFPKGGRPRDDQGKYYCGAGADRIFGREIVEEHMYACLDAGILIAGINAEVMPGQWEYQVGNGTDASDPLRVADDLVVARYLMDRICETHGVIATLDPKPVDGWNGAGAHTNVSTVSMRESDAEFQGILKKLEAAHDKHIAVYGEGIERRLTGKYETCDVKTFKYGVSDRGASIRIPWQVAAEGRGYIEDRRPCANIDPYVVFAKIMETMMG